jgi:intracellular sulfur oxidation DsrE/DsrF family protein
MIKKQISLILLVIFVSMTAIAQTGAPDDLLFLLRKKEHLAQALVTAEQLRQPEAATTIHAGKIMVILCGEEVKMLADTASASLIRKAKLLNVDIAGCGLSLGKFSIKKEQLLPGVQYVPNGFIKAFELQKQGYLSVEL